MPQNYEQTHMKLIRLEINWFLRPQLLSWSWAGPTGCETRSPKEDASLFVPLIHLISLTGHACLLT